MNIGVLISLIAAGMNFLGLIYFATMRQSRIESRMEILWAFHIRRGISEAVEHGLLTSNSPLELKKNVVPKYPSLFESVRDFYDRLGGKKLSDVELVAQMEDRFWPMIKPLCLKEKINDGACLAILLHTVRPESKYFKEWEEIEGACK